MSFEHPVERGEDEGRSRFDKLAEAGSNFVSSPAFFAICVALILAWAAGYALHLSEHTLHLLGEGMAALTLLLVALLKNAELRSEHAIQAKLDAIAAALLEEGEDRKARDKLREAIGMHDEV
jgi:low affinity Fe/Cu permease